MAGISLPPACHFWKPERTEFRCIYKKKRRWLVPVFRSLQSLQCLTLRPDHCPAGCSRCIPRSGGRGHEPGRQSRGRSAGVQCDPPHGVSQLVMPRQKGILRFHLFPVSTSQTPTELPKGRTIIVSRASPAPPLEEKTRVLWRALRSGSISIITLPTIAWDPVDAHKMFVGKRPFTRNCIMRSVGPGFK
jgi:hypothetical protein